MNYDTLVLFIHWFYVDSRVILTIRIKTTTNITLPYQFTEFCSEWFYKLIVYHCFRYINLITDFSLKIAPKQFGILPDHIMCL